MFYSRRTKVWSLGFERKKQNPIPLESYQVCFSHGIWRIGFLSSVYLVLYVQKVPKLYSTHCQWEKKSTPPNPEIATMRENTQSTKWVIQSAIPAMLESSSHNLCLRLPPCATTVVAYSRKRPKLLSS